MTINVPTPPVLPALPTAALVLVLTKIPVSLPARPAVVAGSALRMRPVALVIWGLVPVVRPVVLEVPDLMATGVVVARSSLKAARWAWAVLVASKGRRVDPTSFLPSPCSNWI